jgi:hypothetical protein
MPNALYAWREILARIFADFPVQENVTPPWLVNPTTRRQLKLDLLYPDAATAVRFVGLLGQRKTRLSDQEVAEAAARDDNRAELCRRQGITLVVIDPEGADPRAVFKEIANALSRASRSLAQSQRPDPEKAKWMPHLATARRRCEDLLGRIRRPEDLDLYADLWRDREANLIAMAQEHTAEPPQAVPLREYRPGQWVRHTVYGAGNVVRVEPRPDDTYITVRFVTAGERTFSARLAADKLLPQ